MRLIWLVPSRARGFELAPRVASGKTLELKQPETLARIKLPMAEPRPTTVVLDRAGDLDLIAGLTARWSTDENMTLRAIDKLCLPLWLAYGASRMEADEQNLILTWEGMPARITLVTALRPGAVAGIHCP